MQPGGQLGSGHEVFGLTHRRAPLVRQENWLRVGAWHQGLGVELGPHEGQRPQQIAGAHRAGGGGAHDAAQWHRAELRPAQRPVGVQVAATAAHVVRVQAEGHVQVTAAERQEQGAAYVLVQVEHRVHERPRLGVGLRVRVDQVLVQQGGSLGHGAGVLQRGHVLRHRGDAQGLGHGLDDQPFAAGGPGQLGGLPQQQVRALRRGRVDAHVRVDHHVPAHPGQQFRAQPAQREHALAVLGQVGTLCVAGRDAAHPVLVEEQRLQGADRDELARRAELPHHAAAEALQVRLGRAQAREQLGGPLPVA